MAFLINILDKDGVVLHNYVFVPIGISVDVVVFLSCAVSQDLEDVNPTIIVQDVQHSSIHI